MTDVFREMLLGRKVRPKSKKVRSAVWFTSKIDNRLAGLSRTSNSRSQIVVAERNVSGIITCSSSADSRPGGSTNMSFISLSCSREPIGALIRSLAVISRKIPTAWSLLLHTAVLHSAVDSRFTNSNNWPNLQLL